MTASELSRRFFDISQSGIGPRAGSSDPVASLYGLEEVTIDAVAQTVTVHAPGMSPMHCPGIGDVVGADWYATMPVRSIGGALDFVVGFGDPYDARADNSLPRKSGHVMAIPASAVPYAMSEVAGMNRAQRRAMKR